MKLLVTADPADQVVRVHGYVWCHIHGAVHEDVGDPFDDGTPCGAREWQTLWMVATND
jgi:hypothetical protein